MGLYTDHVAKNAARQNARGIFTLAFPVKAKDGRFGVRLARGEEIVVAFEQGTTTMLRLADDPAGVRFFEVQTSDLIAAIDV